MSPVDTSQLAVVRAAVEREYGLRAINMGDEEPDIIRIPFDSPFMNYITKGGVPEGRITRFFGGYSSGKSLMAWQIAKNALEAGKEVVYYNLEQQFDRQFTAGLGVDVSRLQIVQGQRIEQVGAILESMLGVAHVHIIDSRSSGTSVDELSTELKNWPPMAVKVRAWAKVFDHAADKFDPHENTLVITDQVRDAFGMGSEHPPGGRQMEHISDLTIHFKRGGWLYYGDGGVLSPDAKKSLGLTDQTQPDGWELQARVIKSRVCRPNRVASMRLDLNTFRFDKTWELVQACKYFRDLGGVSASAGYYSLPDGRKLHGQAKARAEIEADEGLRQMILDDLAARS